MSDPQSKAAARKPRRRLAPSEKYEIYVQVLTQQATQREAAEKWGVDRSTVVHICRTAKKGALDALATSVPGRKKPRLAGQKPADPADGIVAGAAGPDPRLIDVVSSTLSRWRTCTWALLVTQSSRA